MTQKEWWQLAHNHKQVIEQIILDYHPLAQGPMEYVAPMPITAPGAQAACDDIVSDIRSKGAGRDIKKELEKAYGNKDYDKLMNLCHETWFGVPESLECWSIAGFDELCDLMEGWDDDDEDDINQDAQKLCLDCGGTSKTEEQQP